MINYFILRRVRVRLGDEAKKVATMKWYSYIILLLMYIIYLAIGAWVFQMFEKPHEVSISYDTINFILDIIFDFIHMVRYDIWYNIGYILYDKFVPFFAQEQYCRFSANQKPSFGSLTASYRLKTYACKKRHTFKVKGYIPENLLYRQKL